jgi:Skp family chaperone for outer membrane proteins
MKIILIIISFLSLTLLHANSFAQPDTAIPNIAKIPVKFIEQTNAKIDKYTNRITSKTEKTLQKLAKWENKIKGLLQKADPATAEKLFGQGKITFTAMLEKVKEGKAITDNYKAKYDAYTDKLITNIKYVETQKDQLDAKYIKPLQAAKEKAKQLQEEVAETENAQKLIKERKKELLAEAYKVLGKSKYLTKINKEAYYYTETLRNYKELFNDPKKAEQKAFELLNKIPAVKDFVQQNSMLASLFGNPSTSTNGALLAGLQTRSSVNNLIQGRIAAGGPNAAAQISANMQTAQTELKNLKDKILKAGGTNSDAELPDFKPNTEKSKTFKQRLEFGSNFQFGKPNRFVGSQADLAISTGYKLNNKSIIGIGFSYKLDYGSINNFYLKHGGIGLRSFVDYKLKKQFFISGGYEMNYNQSFKSLSDLRISNNTIGIGNPWSKSGLLGISKKIGLPSSFGGAGGGLTKWIKGTKVSLLYDMLHNTHAVPTQPVVFRMGYNF